MHRRTTRYRLAVTIVASSGLVALTIVPSVAQDDQTDLTIPRNVQVGYEAGTRSPDGNPGPNYWQNEAVHDISLQVSPPDRRVTGSEEITYTNNSPNALPFLAIRLYQNSHRPTALREQLYSEDFLTKGAVIDRFAVNGQELTWEPLELGLQTVKTVLLPEPLGPGESVDLSFDWHFDLPLEAVKDGVIDPSTFFIAYFFPRVSVYSDTDASIYSGSNAVFAGWDLQEYTYTPGRERNDDFADFTFDVTVPRDFVVWATGELLDPEAVLQPEIAARLEASMTGDEVVTVATPSEVAAGEVTAQTDTVTWRFRADHVNDVAIGLSDHFVWDAGSVEVDPETGRRVSLEAAYPESATDYQTMVADTKDIVTFGSTRYPGVPWPYPKATIFVGGADEEYPMMANDAAGIPPGIVPEFVHGRVRGRPRALPSVLPVLHGQ